MKSYLNFIILFIGVQLFIGCELTAPGDPEEYELLDGPAEGLSKAESRRFVLGDEAFNDQIFTAETGLGPIFTGTSCVSCHAGDGKGHPFNSFTRFGQSDASGNHYLDQGGPQLQNKALPGYEPEVLPSGAPYAKLVAPAVTGLGYFEAVTDAYLLDSQDPDDMDGDGIRGVVNWNKIPDYVTPPDDAVTQNGMHITRFGKKAGVYNLLEQTADAYNQDIGITSVYESYDTYSGDKQGPEIDEKTINDVVFYLKTLKAPIQRNQDDPTVVAGGELFNAIDCAKCHSPTMETGYSPIDAISNKTFHPYTDLLLHDLGSELDDGYTEGVATSAQWRTAPLWGLGLSGDSQGNAYYLMHDGRAHNIDQAIMLHGGEADNSRSMYENLSGDEKEQLMTFLESL
ncbi:MAG: di-heme oxidoredictase family protein [Flavobacteriaceae bacterium]